MTGFAAFCMGGEDTTAPLDWLSLHLGHYCRVAGGGGSA